MITSSSIIYIILFVVQTTPWKMKRNWNPGLGNPENREDKAKVQIPEPENQQQLCVLWGTQKPPIRRNSHS